LQSAHDRALHDRCDYSRVENYSMPGIDVHKPLRMPSIVTRRASSGSSQRSRLSIYHRITGVVEFDLSARLDVWIQQRLCDNAVDTRTRRSCSSTASARR